ncbi:hypothetical protein K4L44_16710 [Halosquirtibacter laminarini]|uniref:Uncharacterized protein n=1 Tax=Halosquirtibacter laminarini TaxID=3374600 RepID=A0AC61NPD5_9BACT|nr:hypothetical protein K4L44_16710 [Prolixibacteraceae bacterium]
MKFSTSVYRKSVQIFTILLLLTSCVSKRMYKKGLALEKANMPIEAAEYYLVSVQKNHNNVDARIALRRTGQQVLDRDSKRFMQSYKEQNNEAAVDRYKQMRQYYHQLKGLGVNIVWNNQLDIYYEEVKDAFISSAYQKGALWLSQERFRDAATILSKVYDLNPNFRDVAEKRKEAIYEPIFRRGQRLLSEGAPRKAYSLFDHILKNGGEYRDSKLLREEALELAKITMVITPCLHGDGLGRMSSSVKPYTENAIKSNPSPFYGIKIDPKEAFFHLDLSEYLRYVHGMGANAIVRVKLNDTRYWVSDLERTKECAYTKYTEVYKDKDGNKQERTVYDKKFYYEYRASSSFRYYYQFTLISALTGEVLMTKQLEGRCSDRIRFAETKGDYRKLIPGYFEKVNKDSPKDYVKDDKRAIRSLHTLFNARNKLVPIYEMQKQAAVDMAQNIAKYACQYNGDKQVE